MFNESDKARAALILAKYGATHFMLAADGALSVCVGASVFPVEGEHLLFDLNDSERATLTANEAIAKASGG